MDDRVGVEWDEVGINAVFQLDSLVREGTRPEPMALSNKQVFECLEKVPSKSIHDHNNDGYVFLRKQMNTLQRI